LGIHSRIETVQQRVATRLRAGNTYINRNQVGAMVGVQPFGGRGLSGTGPKAGSPITLHRFAEERVISVNTAAAGGNAALLASDEG
jgi:RHH-type proline utilization regulon transcriptional repressor/proline dehydrogenase/delta 1-pyrroline-5-carboxylate dehydrogenase